MGKTENGEDITRPSESALTMLWHGALSGDISCLRCALAEGVDVNTPLRKGRQTALHVVARYGHATACEYLLQRGADPDRVSRNGSTPLHLAATGKRDDVIRLLLAAGAKVNSLDGHNHTPLANLIWCSDSAGAARALLEAGATMTYSARSGDTLAHWAAFFGRHAILNELLEHGADPNAFDHDHSTPLHKAVSAVFEQGAELCVNVLLEHGADPTLRDADGQTPYEIASQDSLMGEEGLAGIIELLEQKRASTSSRDAEPPGNEQ